MQHEKGTIIYITDQEFIRKDNIIDLNEEGLLTVHEMFFNECSEWFTLFATLETEDEKKEVEVHFMLEELPKDDISVWLASDILKGNWLDETIYDR